MENLQPFLVLLYLLSLLGSGFIGFAFGISFVTKRSQTVQLLVNLFVIAIITALALLKVYAPAADFFGTVFVLIASVVVVTSWAFALGVGRKGL